MILQFNHFKRLLDRLVLFFCGGESQILRDSTDKNVVIYWQFIEDPHYLEGSANPLFRIA